MSIDALLRHPRFGIAVMVEVMNSWITEFGDRSDFMVVRYEDLRAEPARLFTNCSEQSARRKSTMLSSVLPSIFPISEICRSWKRRAHSDRRSCNRATERIRNHSKSGRAKSAVSGNISRPKARVTPRKCVPGSIHGSVTTLLSRPGDAAKSRRRRLPGGIRPAGETRKII